MYPFWHCRVLEMCFLGRVLTQYRAKDPAIISSVGTWDFSNVCGATLVEQWLSDASRLSGTYSQ